MVWSVPLSLSLIVSTFSGFVVHGKTQFAQSLINTFERVHFPWKAISSGMVVLSSLASFFIFLLAGSLNTCVQWICFYSMVAWRCLPPPKQKNTQTQEVRNLFSPYFKSTPLIEYVQDSIWIAQQYNKLGARMVVMPVERNSNQLVIYSPISLIPELKEQIDNLGIVTFIVVPNSFHKTFLREWTVAYPDATVFVSTLLSKSGNNRENRGDEQPEGDVDDHDGDENDGSEDVSVRSRVGVRIRAREVDVEVEVNTQVRVLGTLPMERNQPNRLVPESKDIQYMVFRGHPHLNEIILFHTPSRTLILGDMIKNINSSEVISWWSWLRLMLLMELDRPTPPNTWKLTVDDRQAVKETVDGVFGNWKFKRIVMSKGNLVEKDARKIFEDAFAFVMD
eukprot:TRINITY_DN2656_c0_g1_i6.p1 TRINITY_DN2656_c0_g1~~TRINITY_DN2656_c0_g1_i6.p1  ORF type:complete len:393 (+),score=81.22 TRINITY_DN2656_c0_g1_i6:331-1509(+)